MPPSPQSRRHAFSSVGEKPAVDTLKFVCEALTRSELPLSRSLLLAELARRGRGISHPELDKALGFLAAEGDVVESAKGVMWVPAAGSQLSKIVRSGPRL